MKSAKSNAAAPTFSIGKTDLYIEIALEAYVEYVVSENLTADLSSGKGAKEPTNQRYKAIFTLRSIESQLKCVIFSAFAIESFINKLGRLWLPKNIYTNQLERKLTILDKWITVFGIAKGLELNRGSEPLQSIALLISERDRLAHDKPRQLTREEFLEAMQDKVSSIDGRQAFSTLMKIEIYMTKQLENPDFYHFVPLHLQRRFLQYDEMISSLTVDDGLILEMAKFPSLEEYKIFIERRIGAGLGDLAVNASTKKIVRAY